MYNRTKEQMHFIGIGGIGMSGIAEVLARLGFPVSGSDQANSETIQKLRKLGIQVYVGHRAENLVGAKVVIFSSAVQPDNVELCEARRLGLPIVSRAEMLAELMRLKFGVAIAGSHGKTTTTSMLGAIMTHAGQDPTIIVGGKVNVLGGNARLGQGNLMIAEADESDGSFLRLSPIINIVTNIDNDHLDFYKHIEKLQAAFVEFINKIPYYGRNILCIDDTHIEKLLPQMNKPIWTYGFSKNAHFQIKNYAAEELGSQFELWQSLEKLCTVQLKIPGAHNAQNATAALVAALDLDVSLEKALEALKNFSGVQRRFEIIGHFNGAKIIDDYGHHPTEIQVTLSTARGLLCDEKDVADTLPQLSLRLIVAFQPHRYSRTQICWNQFKDAFKDADLVYLLDIYPAGENLIDGIHSQRLAQSIERCEYIGSLKKAEQVIRNTLRPGDTLITLGAGSITKLGPALIYAHS